MARTERLIDLRHSANFGNPGSLSLAGLTVQATAHVHQSWMGPPQRCVQRYSRGRRSTDNEEKVNGQPTQL